MATRAGSAQRQISPDAAGTGHSIQVQRSSVCSAPKVPQIIDEDAGRDAVREDPGVVGGDLAAAAVPDEHAALDAELAQAGVQVGDVVLQSVEPGLVAVVV